MCGILGLVGAPGTFNHRLLHSLRKRGPDAVGFWSDGLVHLAQTRLAIIGLDERGTGPLENESHVLAYNGEIYNFNDLRRRLEAVGVYTSGANDAAVLLQAWRHWGPRVLEELTGFWAFVIYDKVRRKLFLARDQFGVKPLYYWHSRNATYVASLLRTLLDVVGEGPELDYAALSEYVQYQFTFGDKTFVKQIRKVLPGHLVEIDLDSGAISSRCYEDIFGATQEPLRRVTPEVVEETRRLLVECILESTISDTPFTTFCSGGIDSSLITRITRPEVAYHGNYSDPDCNETFYAQRAVEDTATRLFVVNAQESFDLVARLKDLIEDFDELSIGSVILPLDDVLAQVKRRYKVILIGTGGDELFGGYVRYQLAVGECFQESYRPLYQKTQHLATAAERFELTHRKGELAYYTFFESDVHKTFRDAYEACRHGDDDLSAMLRFDRKYFLAGLLNIDDKMCGRHSLEGRPSLLHQRFVRHVQGLDTRDFFHGAQLKPLLRQAAEGIVPPAILQRTDKMGFTTPIGTFVNRSSHLIREQLANSRFRHLYDLRRMNFTAETKFSREIFGLLILDLWLNRYVTC